jgi:hypothetical protein
MTSSSNRGTLERIARRVPIPEPAYDRLVRRGDRKRRNQRILAGSVGIAVFVAAMWLLSGRFFDRNTEPAVPGASAGTPGASAGRRAETRVTIQTERVLLFKARVWGTVQSGRPSKCAKDRKVVLFRQSGLEQHPKTDEKVAERRASPRGERYTWSLTLARPDYRRQLYYARVDSTEFCKAESTRTVHVIFAGA